MTDIEKKHITMLRNQGLTYQLIAKETGKSLSAIKMFLIRKKASADSNRICPHCKKPIAKDAPMKKRFCSDKCRTAWWLNHPEQLNDALKHLHKCPVCGRSFYSYKPARFCSSSCYHRSRRKDSCRNV